MTLVREYQPTFVLGDGVTKEFSYLFEEVSENFIKVIVKHDDESTYVPVYSVDLDSHKVVFGDSEPAPLDTDVICIYRETPDLQDTPFRTLQGYDAKALENILTKIVAMIQELKANGFSTQILQGYPWQLDLLNPVDDSASVVIDYNARILKKGLYFRIQGGNLQVSSDGNGFITMPKSADILEFRQQHIVYPDLTTDDYLEYRIGNQWFPVTADFDTKHELLNHTSDTNNPHQVTKDQVGLGNCDNTADTDKPISSATQDALDDLQDEIDSLKGIGRFLSIWNCATGLAETNPPESPYEYATGDYFLVGTVDSTTNYKPNGSSYTTGVASTTVETNVVKINDVYVYDGTTWKLQENSQRDVVFAGIQGSPYDNTALGNALNSKVDETSTAGQVYATDGSGNQTTLSYGAAVADLILVRRPVGGQINVPLAPTDDAHATSKKYVDTALSAKQNSLTAGTNITISGSTISAKDTTYTAGENITIESTGAEDYTLLEYIQSNGSQYIDTGVSGLDSGNWIIYVKWMQTAAPTTSYSYIAGAYNSESHNAYRIITKQTAANGYYVNGNSAAGTGSVLADNYAANVVHQGYIRNGSVTIDSTTYTTSTQGTAIPSGVHIFLLGSSNLGKTSCKLYESWATQNGVEKYHFYPAIRNSDSAVGMYDTVGQRFITGSGTFAAGPVKGDGFVIKGKNWSVANLTDTEITSPSDGQHLVYDANDQKWKNKTSAASASWGGIIGTLSDQTDLQNALDSKANTDLSNLTSTGANIGNWSHNVTNCITEIPQDIKLELNNGTLTLKAGSKVYVPNGFEADGVTPKFDVITIASDLTNSDSGNTRFMFYDVTNNEFRSREVTNSGTSDPATPATAYYDTGNNIINYYTMAGVRSTAAFPICIVSGNPGVASIDQVFNGFGYIGRAFFVLPGVKGLIPNGRNTDETLRSTMINTTSVKIGFFAGDRVILLDANGSPSITNIDPLNIRYDEQTNHNIKSNGDIVNSCMCGIVRVDSYLNIKSLQPKTVFHAVDYNDTEFIGHQSKPNNKYVDITYGANGAVYIMPADGYLCVGVTHPDNTNWEAIGVDVLDANNNFLFNVGGAYNLNNQSYWFLVPVSKNFKAQIWINGFSFNRLRFIYDNGSV